MTLKRMLKGLRTPASELDLIAVGLQLALETQLFGHRNSDAAAGRAQFDRASCR